MLCCTLQSLVRRGPNPLVESYCCDFSQVEHLYPYNPQDPKAISARHEELSRSYVTDRQALASILRDYNRAMGASAETMSNIEKLQRPDSAVVVGGQQAGILTGPLYTIYKAVTIIQLARRYSQDLEIPVIPVFWVASEDHDFQEIDHATILDKEDKPLRLRLRQNYEEPRSIKHQPCDERVMALIDCLQAATGPTQHKDGIVDHLRTLAQESDNLADWFARVMLWLFRDYGLVLIDPMLSGIRALQQPVMSFAIARHQQIQDALASGAADLEKLGCAPQIIKEPPTVDLFIYEDGYRRPLEPLDAEAQVTTPRGLEKQYSKEDLLREIARNPEGFSTNVVTRPLAQDVLLPTLAMVGGPGELTYLTQLRPVYELYGMKCPPLFPRVNITLVEPAVRRYLDKFGLSVDELRAGWKDRLEEHLNCADPIDFPGRFDELRKVIEREYAGLLPALGEIDKTLVDIGGTNRGKLLEQIDWLEKKTKQLHEGNCRVAVRQFTKMGRSLVPDGPQERRLNVFPFLFDYSLHLIDCILEQDLIDTVETEKLLFL